MKLKIVEIFNDGTMSASSVDMAIVKKETLQGLTNQDYNTNIVMVKAKRNLVILSDEIRRIDDKFNVLVFETDEMFKDSVSSFQMFVIALVVCVVIVTCLFTMSVFGNFVYKYRHDLALLRMMGGTAKQTKEIFVRMVRIILLCGTILGFITSLIINNFFIEKINQRLALIHGKCEFFFFKSILLAIGICLIMYIILQVIIRKTNRILPIEALAINEVSKIGKIRKRKKLHVKLLKGDLYISRKLIKSRIKENILMLATISMLIAISIFGASLSTLIKKNSEEYYKSQYLSEIVLTTSRGVPFDEGQVLYKELQADPNIKVSYVCQVSPRATVNGKDIKYAIADMRALTKQGIIKPTSIKDNMVIVSETFAENNHIKLNDSITVKAPDTYIRDELGNKIGIDKYGDTYSLTVVQIKPDNQLMFCDAYIDVNSAGYLNDGVFLNNIYIDGDTEYINNKLEELKVYYPYIKWASYTETLTTSDKAIGNRFLMIELVVRILVVIAAIGWINSIRNLFLTRIRDYDIIRMQGVRRRRIVKIMIYQIGMYLFIGVFLGTVIGCTILESLVYMDGGKLLFSFNFDIVIQMLCIMLIFCMSLIPVIKKICNKQILSQ
ncbi:FtsX-like permease family protein [Anaerosporobacter sp.]